MQKVFFNAVMPNSYGTLDRGFKTPGYFHCWFQENKNVSTNNYGDSVNVIQYVAIVHDYEGIIHIVSAGNIKFELLK